MTLDRFGNDIYAPPEDLTPNTRSGDFRYLARPWERGYIASLPPVDKTGWVACVWCGWLEPCRRELCPACGRFAPDKEEDCE